MGVEQSFDGFLQFGRFSAVWRAFSPKTYALDPESGAAFVRVVDVGAGLCCVVTIPGPSRDHYVIHDAWDYEDNGASAFEAIMELIPLGKTIDLLVLSHTDSDHLAAVPLICAGYKVNEVIRGGARRPSKTWRCANRAIERELDDDGQYGHLEWKAGSAPGQEDEPGDDDVDILIRKSGELIVEYRSAP